MIIRQQLAHIDRQDQRIKELEAKVDSDSEAGILVRHLDTEINSLFTFLLEEGVDPTNNFGERMLCYAAPGENAAKAPAVKKATAGWNGSFPTTCRLHGKSSFHVLVAAQNSYYMERESDLVWIRSVE